MGAVKIFSYVITSTFSGGAIIEEGISSPVYIAFFLVISRFVFHKPSYVYEKEG